MNVQHDAPEWLLRRDRPLRLTGARGHCIHCLEGILWLTQEGEPGDLFLHPGESHTLAVNGLVLVEAVSQGRACLVPPGASLTARSKTPAATVADKGLFDLFRTTRTALPLA